MPIRCKDCKTQASFGYEETGKIEYCKSHKKDGMVNVKDKKCKYKDCNKKSHPLGNDEYCISHGGGKRCNYNDCKNSIRSNIDKFCITHGGGKRCNYQNCDKGASGKTDYCRSHGGGNRCCYKDCSKSSIDNSGYCCSHGGGKRCFYKNCKSLARSKSIYCCLHGGGKRCSYDNCNKGSDSNSDYCRSHGGGKRCPNCIDWIDSRCGSNKYDGYCATCFKRIFPNDERSKIIRQNTKEIRVRNEINKNFEGFVHDKPLYTHNCDCTHRRRIDHRKLIGNTILAIETDEFAHSGYDPLDEEIRYDDLYMIHSGKWVFIRFNPDGGNIDLEDKLEVLINEINTQIVRIENEENIDLLDIVKLYY